MYVRALGARRRRDDERRTTNNNNGQRTTATTTATTEKNSERERGGAYFEEWLAFMRRRNLPTNAFFWTFPPTSSDTGGLLGQDWATLDAVKLAFLQKLQPDPSQIGA